MEHARRSGRAAGPSAGLGASHWGSGLTPRAPWGTSASHLGCFQELGGGGQRAAVCRWDGEGQLWPSASRGSDPGALRPSRPLFSHLGSMGCCRAPSKPTGRNEKMGCAEGGLRKGRVQMEGKRIARREEAKSCARLPSTTPALPRTCPSTAPALPEPASRSAGRALSSSFPYRSPFTW